MIKEFQYRIKKVYFGETCYYFPQFIPIYSSWFENLFLSRWFHFIQRKYINWPQRPSSYENVSKQFENEQASLDFIKQFSKNPNEGLNPIQYNQTESEKYKTKYIDI